MIIAKPIVEKKFWILRDDNGRVGNVEATDNGYQVVINNQVQEYKTIKMVEQRANIRFEETPKKSRRAPVYQDVYGYKAAHKIYNPMFDVKHNVPVYTPSRSSKSWLAAGWYHICKDRKITEDSQWDIVQDPKLILIHRYHFKGPFHTKEEAENV